MKCGFCDREIPEEIDRQRQRCGACPGGCRMIHCPHCGYANPVVPDLLKRWVKAGDKKRED